MRDGEGGRLGGRLLGAYARTQRRPTAGRRAASTRCVANSPRSRDRVRPGGAGTRPSSTRPVDVERYTPDPTVAREDFFLLAGRLVPYKRPRGGRGAARRCRRAPGRRRATGRARRAGCARRAAPGELLGRVDDATLRDLFRRCRAWCSRARRTSAWCRWRRWRAARRSSRCAPAARWTPSCPGSDRRAVRRGRRPAVGALAAALADFPSAAFDPALVREHALGFSPERFRARMAEVVAPLLASTGRS